MADLRDRTTDIRKRVDATAKRWRVTLSQELLVKPGGAVFKVDTPDGPAVLKVYAKLGYETGAVPFLRGLPPGIGVRIKRTSPLRRAILMEWLEGPTLEDLYHDGKESEAEAHLATAAAALKSAPFKHPFILQRIAKRMKHRLDRCEPILQASAQARLYARTLSLFDMLNQTTKTEGVIHGDLHFCNVMLTPDGPRLIDPKGFRADPAMDCARAIKGPVPSDTADDYCRLITRRADLFGAAMDEKPLRIIQWGAVTRAVRVFDDARRHKTPDNIDPYLSAFLDVAQA